MSDVTDTDAALALAAPRLDPTGRRIAVATYRTLALGKPASLDAIAAAADVDVMAVSSFLDSRAAVFRDSAGDVVGFWGLAVAEMPHRLRVDGRDLYAWCAWAPLFLGLVLGPLRVTTEDPESGDTITYGLDGDGTVQDLSHPDSVLSFLRPDREWGDDVMATFCHYVLQFGSPATARLWTSRHEGTFVLDLATGADLARRDVERTFGGVLA